VTDRDGSVSVVVAVRNGERFLRQAIDSVFVQDYPPLEVILVDGQSDDKTAEIARSFAGIRYLYQENLGTAKAYNQGIEAARGEYVAFLSHDDIWTRDKLRVQAGYLNEHQEVQYTIARVQYFLEPGYAVSPAFHKDLLVGDHVGWMMETLVARRTVYAKVGMLDPEMSPADDTDWYARAKDMNIPMAVIDRVLLHKRVHDENTTLTSGEFKRNLMKALLRSSARKRSLGKG
jgi:glycosyltransferase involved in cell wall biosynthesis